MLEHIDTSLIELVEGTICTDLLFIIGFLCRSR